MEPSPAKVRLAYFVPPSRHFAGIERVVHEIATGLMEAHGDQLDVHVLFSTGYEDLILQETNYTLHVLGVERLRNLAATLRACVRANDFDVLVCPQIEASVIAWLATRGLRLPVFISHLHGNPEIEEAEGTRRTKCAFSIFRHVVSRRIAGVLAVSPSLAHYATKTVAKHSRVYYAKNPVRDLAETHERSPKGDRFRFLSVARLCHQKGQDILLRALARARPDLPPVSLTFIGSGPDEANLRRLSTSLGLDDIVEFAGYRTDPAGSFGAADCFVLSSRWEGFGVALVEALQFGLPLLASDCDFGPSDIITEPAIGELVAPDSVEALALGLKRAVRNPLDGQIDEALRRSVASTFARAEATEQHLAVLKQIAATNPKAYGRLAVLASDRT